MNTPTVSDWRIPGLLNYAPDDLKVPLEELLRDGRVPVESFINDLGEQYLPHDQLRQKYQELINNVPPEKDEHEESVSSALAIQRYRPQVDPFKPNRSISPDDYIIGLFDEGIESIDKAVEHLNKIQAAISH